MNKKIEAELKILTILRQPLEILSKLDELQEKKNTLMQEYSLNKEQFSDLVQYRKNYENYYGKEVER